MKSLAIFSRNLRGDFFFKIGILSVKVYTKKVPNKEECNIIHVQLWLLTTNQVIEVRTLLIGCFNFLGRLYIGKVKNLPEISYKIPRQTWEDAVSQPLELALILLPQQEYFREELRGLPQW